MPGTKTEKDNLESIAPQYMDRPVVDRKNGIRSENNEKMPMDNKKEIQTVPGLLILDDNKYNYIKSSEASTSNNSA